MAYKIVNDDSLTSVANAIRVQGGFSATLEFPDGFVSAIQNLSPSPTLQSKSVAFTPAITIQTSSVTADAGYDGLSEVDVTVNPIPSQYIIPSGSQTITQNNIYDVKSLASVNVSVPTGITPSGTYSITSNGIYDIVSFASVDVNVSGGSGGDHDAEDAIINRTISGAYTNSRVTSIGSYAFYRCTSLTTASFPNVTSIETYAFYSCTSLTTVSFPNATSIGISAFYSCTSLTTASFPNVTSIGQYAFYNCTSLTTASFPVCETFGNQCFRYCMSLESLYVLASSVAVLGNSALLSTPMSLSTYLGYFGSIYVPASLVADYKSGANWSKFSDRITAYEG